MKNRTNEELVNAWATIQEAQEELAKNKYEIELEITRRMTMDGATVLDHPTHDVTLTTTLQYDRNNLHPLRELVPPDVVAKGYTPEHEVMRTVPESWNMTKVKTWKRYGTDARRIIEEAAFPGQAKLTIKAKKGE